MDLLRLDQNFIATDMIQSYDSLVWTERFFGDGEFVLTAKNVGQVSDTLKPGDFVSLRDSREVCQVVTSLIEEDEQGNETLVVRGNSFAHIMMQNRVVHGGNSAMDKKWKLGTERTAGDTALYLFRYFLITGSSGASDVIPGATTTKSFTATDNPQFSTLEKEFLDVHVLTFLNRGVVGLKTVRPLSSGVGINFDFFSGVNRADSVIFNYHNGDLTNPQLLSTNEDFKNVAYIFSPSGMVVLEPNDNSAVGVNRREIIVDGSDILLEDYPGMIGPDPLLWRAAMLTAGYNELQKYNSEVLKMYDGGISSVSGHKYGTDYNLGDSVSLITKYDVPRTMMVTEYVRSFEDGVESGYPTLSPNMKPWTPRPIKKYKPGGGTKKWK